MHIHKTFWFNFFYRSNTPFELRNLSKIKCTSTWYYFYHGQIVCHCNPSKMLKWISWNLIVYKDILCTCVYSQEIMIWFFFSKRTTRTSAKKHDFMQIVGNWFSINDKEAIQSDISLWFSVWLPSQMHGIAIRFVPHCQALLSRAWGMWACSLFLSYFW